jgi:hypothetical protein
MKKDGDKDNSDDPKIWGAVLFGLIGATATTLVVSFSDSFFFSQSIKRTIFAFDYNFFLISNFSSVRFGKLLNGSLFR